MLSRRVLVAVIVAATALFVVGTTIERNERDDHAAAEAGEGEAGHSEEGEAGHSEEREQRGAESTAHEQEESEEILGVDPESPGLIALAAVVSLALAAAAWRFFDNRAVLLVVAATMLAFAALDVREVVHQADENRTGLAVLAGAVAVLHLMAASIAVYGRSSGSGDAISAPGRLA